MLVYKNQTDSAKATALARLAWWGTHDGQKFNKDLAYATVPDALTAKNEEFIRSITVNGKPALGQ
jgi:phosphate transport system substrate-binding protein